MTILKRLLLFLFLNFTALALGSIFTQPGVASNWYENLNKAPWTPPGWVFGAAWTLIMVCFAFYMAYLLQQKSARKKNIKLYSAQWILNVVWSPVFFYFNQVFIALTCISVLTLIVAYQFISGYRQLKIKSLLLAPYVIWLLIATSLNAYIFFLN